MPHSPVPFYLLHIPSSLPHSFYLISNFLFSSALGFFLNTTRWHSPVFQIFLILSFSAFSYFAFLYSTSTERLLFPPAYLLACLLDWLPILSFCLFVFLNASLLACPPLSCLLIFIIFVYHICPSNLPRHPLLNPLPVCLPVCLSEYLWVCSLSVCPALCIPYAGHSTSLPEPSSPASLQQSTHCHHSLLNFSSCWQHSGHFTKLFANSVLSLRVRMFLPLFTFNFCVRYLCGRPAGRVAQGPLQEYTIFLSF